MRIQPIRFYTNVQYQHWRRWNNNKDRTTYEMYFTLGANMPFLCKKNAEDPTWPGGVYLCDADNPNVKLNITAGLTIEEASQYIYTLGNVDINTPFPIEATVPAPAEMTLAEFTAAKGWYYFEVTDVAYSFSELIRFVDCNIYIPANGINSFCILNATLKDGQTVEGVTISGDATFVLPINGEVVEADAEILEEIVEDNVKRITPIFRRVINRKQIEFVATDIVATFMQNLHLFQVVLTDQEGQTYNLDRFTVSVEREGYFAKVRLAFETSDNIRTECA